MEPLAKLTIAGVDVNVTPMSGYEADVYNTLRLQLAVQGLAENSRKASGLEFDISLDRQLQAGLSLRYMKLVNPDGDVQTKADALAAGLAKQIKEGEFSIDQAATFVNTFIELFKPADVDEAKAAELREKIDELSARITTKQDELDVLNLTIQKENLEKSTIVRLQFAYETLGFKRSMSFETFEASLTTEDKGNIWELMSLKGFFASGQSRTAISNA